MNFIKTNLIFKVISKFKEKKEFYKHTGFIYFNNKVGNINRFGNGFLYNEEEILPVQWKYVKGKTLFEIFKQLKSNNFYFYKNINGRLYKTRPKTNVKA